MIDIVYDGKSALELPSQVLKEGYTFDGWYLDNDIFEQPFLEVH